jgi:hypothetical protein
MHHNDDMEMCEIFLRGIEDKSVAGELWKQCQRHEWYDYEWNGERIKRRSWFSHLLCQLRNRIGTYW